ncbi:hypothetical protein VCV18_011542 [Metarhizium anisopliae]
MSQLRNFQGSEVAGEGIYPCAAAGSRFFELTMEHRRADKWVSWCWGQFSETDIDAEDYANVLLSPARPRRYLEQLGIEPDSESGEEDVSDKTASVD